MAKKYWKQQDGSYINDLRKAAQKRYANEKYIDIQQYSAFIEGALWMQDHLASFS